jgi:zinc protease
MIAGWITMIIKLIIYVLIIVVVSLSYPYIFQKKHLPIYTQKQLPNTLFSHGEVKKIILDNGLTALLFKMPIVPTVFLQITYGAGSAYEDTHEKGIAHAIEHMLFKGTKRLAEGDVVAVVRKYGAHMNASTLWDFTSYHVEAMKNNWQPFLPIFADCMENARFDKQHFTSEIKAILQELKIVKETNSRSMFEKMFELSFPPNHPYHFCIGGYKEGLVKLTTDDLKKFYKEYYRPDNAVLFMVGNFDINEAEALINKSFGTIKKPSKPKKMARFSPITEQPIAQQLRYYGNTNKPQLAYYWIIPGLKDKYEIVASVLEFLFENKNGAFYQSIVERECIAHKISVSATKQLEGGLFILTLDPVSNDYGWCYKVVMDEIKKILKNGFSAQEIAMAVQHKKMAFYTRMFNLEEFVRNWSKSYFSTSDEMEIFNRPNKYATVTSSMLTDFVRNYLNPLMMQRLEMLPFSLEKKVLNAKLKKRADAIDKAVLRNLQRSAPLMNASYVKTIKTPIISTIKFPRPNRIIKLQNGLRVCLYRQLGIPLVNFDFNFVNSDHLALSLEGVKVKLLLTMLFENEQMHAEKLFLANHGVDYHIKVNGISFGFLNNAYEEIITKIAVIMMNNNFSQETVDTVTGRLINKYERKNKKPRALLKRTIYKDMYNHLPYGWLYKDACSELKQISCNDLRQLHDKFINTSAINLAIVGDFDLDNMQRVIEEAFSFFPIKNANVTPLSAQNTYPLKNRDLSLSNNLILLALASSSPITMIDEDFVAVKLLDYVRNMRFRRLRERYGLFYSGFGGLAEAATRVHGFNYMGASFEKYAINNAEKLIRANFRQLIRDGITDDELSAAKQLFVSSITRQMSSNDALANSFSFCMSLALPFDYYNSQLNKIKKITCVEVNKIAKKYFNNQKMSRIRIGRLH